MAVQKKKKSKPPEEAETTTTATISPDDIAYCKIHPGIGVARVVPVSGTDAEAALAHLGAGRWWPDLDQLLDGVDRVVPDQVGADLPFRHGAGTL